MSENRNLTEIHLFPYVNEIKTNANWTISLVEKGKEYQNVDFEKVKYYSLAVNAASSILQIAFINVATRRIEKERAEERIELINKYYPEIPSPPSELRNIRNDIQHFDERLDSWMFNQLENHDGNYALIKDGNNNIESFGGSGFQYNRRVLDNGDFLYWDHLINMDKLLNWCKELIEYLE